MAGFGPTSAGVKVPCLTAWLHPNAFSNFLENKENIGKRQDPHN